MGKRSTFERRERDFYPTPESAATPLFKHLNPHSIIHEPCAGDGALFRAWEKWQQELGNLGYGYAVSDIAPRLRGIGAIDAMHLECCWGDIFVTNPPWPLPGQQGEPTVSIALHLSNLAPTWLLLSADFAHNGYFTKSGLADRCEKIVSVGRVSWMENGTAGKDNCAWYLFDAKHQGATQFVGRAA